MTGHIDWQAVAVSLRLATVTTILLVTFTTPLSYWLSRTKKNWKVIVESIVALPLVLPPTVLGFYLLWGTGPRSPLGRFLQNTFGQTIPFSFEGLVLGSLLYSLPFAIQPMVTAFSAVDEGLIEASRLLGDGRLGTFFRTALPLSYRGIFAAATLTMAHTIGEFGVVLMIGGNIPGKTRTISISIYDSVQALDYATASTTSAMLLAVSFAALILVNAFSKGARAPWPRV